MMPEKKLNLMASSSLATDVFRRLTKSPLVKKAFSGSFWLTLGSMGGKLLTLLSSIVAARLLGQSGFGELGIIQGTVYTFAVFGGFGLGLTANKHVAEFRHSDPLRAVRILSLSRQTAYVTGALACGLVFLFSRQLAAGAMGNPQLFNELQIASLCLLLGAVTGAQTGALSGFEEFRVQSKINMLSGVASCIFMTIGVFLGGLVGAVWAMVATSAFTWWMTDRSLKEQIRAARFPVNELKDSAWSEWPILLKFSVPAVLSGLSVLPVNWGCNLILVNQPNGYAEMGVLNAAIQWRNIILFLPGIMMAVALPMLTSLGASREIYRQRKLLLLNIGVASVAGFSIAFGVTLFAEPIMASYGAEFRTGSSVLILQAFSAAIAAVVGVVGQFIISRGEMWLLIALQCLWASINLGLTWYFRHQGAKGLSMAYLIAYVVHLITMSSVTFWKMQKLVNQSAQAGEAKA